MPVGQLDGTIQIAVVDPTNPTAVPQGQPAATKDNLAANTVPVVENGLLNPSGTGVDRWREAVDFPPNSGLVADPTLQAQMQIAIGYLRTLILLMVKQNQILGGQAASAKINADDPDATTWIQAGILPINGILDFMSDPIKLQ